jgi:hypothetical protein
MNLKTRQTRSLAADLWRDNARNFRLTPFWVRHPNSSVGGRAKGCPELDDLERHQVRGGALSCPAHVIHHPHCVGCVLLPSCA